MFDLIAVFHLLIHGAQCQKIIFRMGGEHIVRCLEPTYPGCSSGYCIAHCRLVCLDVDGNDGDEEEATPPIWEPKKDDAGKEVVQS